MVLAEERRDDLTSPEGKERRRKREGEGRIDERMIQAGEKRNDDRL